MTQDLRTCPKCKKVYAANFEACPHCSSWLSYIGCFGLVAGAIAISLVACQPNAEEKQEAAERHAGVVCQEAVKRELRDPSSADFGGFFNLPVMHDEGTTYTATLGVRATNGFGGKSTASFSCTYSKATGGASVLELP